MQEIAERITKVIKDKAKTKTEFAEKLNISQSFVSRLASGEKEPSDRTIADICREFDVNEDWLRTGRGDPYIQLSRDEELARGQAAFTPHNRQRPVSKALQAYAALVSSADKGAVRII